MAEPYKIRANVERRRVEICDQQDNILIILEYAQALSHAHNILTLAGMIAPPPPPGKRYEPKTGRF